MIKKSIIEGVAIETYEAHRSKFQNLKQRWLDLVSRYENKLRAGSITSQTEAKVGLGGAYALVENSIPRILARQPKYRYLGREKGDVDAAEVYDQFSEYQWQEADVQKKLRKMAKWGMITGLAGWVMGWKEEKRVIQKRTKEVMGVEVKNKLLEKFGKEVVKSEEEVTSNYTFTPLKPFDLIWSVEAEELEDIRVLGYKSRKTLKQLKAEGYETRKVANNIMNSDYWRQQMDQKDGMTNYRKGLYLEDQEVEVAELYLRLLNDEGYFEYYIVTLATYQEGDAMVIRNEKNTLDQQFIPMGIWRPVERPGKIYGFGMIEPEMGILDAEEDTLNMALEALWTDISRPMEYNPHNVVAPNEIKYGPRVMVPVKNLGQSVRVMETPIPNINGVSYINDYLLRAKQNVAGITDYQTGSEQLAGRKTLGEIQIKTQESNSRMAMVVDSFEKEVLEPMGKMALWFNQQFLADNKKIIFRILGKKGKVIEEQIKFKSIEAIKDVVIVSGSTALAAQNAEIQKWSLLLNQAYMEEKSPQPTPINKEAIWERLLEQGFIIKDVENFLPSLKEREIAEVTGNLGQIADAKEENAHPMTARVLPTDSHDVHIKLHEAEIIKRQDEMTKAADQYPEQFIEELQMLIQHYNDHIAAVGGRVPPFSAALQVGQGTNVGANMPMAGGGTPSGGAVNPAR
jgi:hypothetical protein